MRLILCDIGDAAALWAAARLQERGVPVDLIFSPALGAATRWEHRVDSSAASIKITLADGRMLSSDVPVAILNRMAFVPTERLLTVAGADYGYAVQEMFAFYLSWLHAWPAIVLNRPTPQGLSGNYRHPAAWVKLAAAAGLPVRPWVQSAADGPELTWMPAPVDTTAFVVEGTVILPPVLPSELADGCRALATAAGSGILGIDFVRDGDGSAEAAGSGWRFAGASPMPNLMLGGEPLIDALAQALRR